MSESIVVILGSPLPLSFTTPDGSSGRFIRAAVFDAAQSPVAGSPFVLTEAETGRYTSAAFTPGAIGNFTAHFIVYTDGGFGTELEIFEQDQDSFTVLDPALFGYLAADRTRDDQIAIDTGASLPAAITTAEGNIRGGDSRDLTNLAGAGWVAADNLVQAHNKLDGIQTDIDNFENITRFKISIPPLERPEAGTTLHEITFNLKDDQGLPVDADGGGGGTVTVQATSFGGSAGDRDGRLGSTTMTNIGTGRYEVTFSVASTDILEGIRFFFSWAEGGNANNDDRSSHVQDGNEVGYLASDRVRDDAISVQTTSLDGTKITTARANNLDEITAVRLAELDAVNLPADVDQLLLDTAQLITTMTAASGIVSAGASSTSIPSTIALAADSRPVNMQLLVADASGFLKATNVNGYSTVGGTFEVTDLGFTPAPGAVIVVLARTGSVPVDLSAIAEAVRDVNLAAAASGSLGEGIIVAKNSKLAYRIDKYVRNSDNGFADTARIRIFASQADAAASTSGNPDGDDNELEKATLTGTPHGTFVVLPIDIVTGP